MERGKGRTITTIVIAVFTLMILGGCGTAAGFGRDLQLVGQWMEETLEPTPNP